MGQLRELAKIVEDAHHASAPDEEIKIDLRELMNDPISTGERHGLAQDPIDALLEKAAKCDG